MSTMNATVGRALGKLLLAGAAAGLIGLGASGIAGATPDTPRIPVIPPGNPVIARYLDPGIAVELNPQPLPPRQWAPGVDDALNPQPLPPGPPDPEFWIRSGLMTDF
ncbi:MAG: hypothetical protein JO044_09075 [Mycobacteriaceae bacterium]|nr:hypothetical protein [Mycobacteriaceae bacterium]